MHSNNYKPIFGIETVPNYKFIEYGVAFLALYVTLFFLFVFLRNIKRIREKPKPISSLSISIIIPAYNEEKNIGRCIESVLNVDYPRKKLEIIVVDDGSYDRTSSIALRYKKYGVRIFRKKNEGKANALNFGIKKAKGELIATLDADSVITKESIKRMTGYFADPEVAAVTSAVKVHRPKNFWEKLQAVEYLYTIFTRRVLMFLDAVYVTPGPLSMFRKWVFKKLGGFDPMNILEDQEIALRIQANNYKIMSSLDADVYTIVPKDFSSLLKQRTRWHRGGLRNTLKYLNLVHPKYGDFGVMISPLSLVAVTAIFLVFLITILYYLSVSTYSLDVSTLLFYNLSSLHFILLAVLLLTILWIYYGIKTLKKKIDVMVLGIYILCYAYLITIFWVSAIFHELIGQRLNWYTKK